jgi:DNA-binding transcriptional ArsR family regulator
MPVGSLGTDCFKYIRNFEYTIENMSDALRRFKSEIFQGLAHPTRIAIVELLREGELSAGTLIEKLRIEQANASQHLAVLRAKQILVSRKVGNQVYYSIRDHALIEVLDILRRYFYAQLNSTVSILKEAAREEPKSRLGGRR